MVEHAKSSYHPTHVNPHVQAAVQVCSQEILQKRPRAAAVTSTSGRAGLLDPGGEHS